MTEPPSAEPLPIAVRAYAPPPRPKKRPRRFSGQGVELPPSEYTLVFDCETTKDTAHTLRFGAFQVRRTGSLYRAGLFENPDALNADDRATLRDYAALHDVELHHVRDFVDDIFFRYAYELGGLCVGFNLPFDLSRLAIADRRARGRYRNGFSFELSEDPTRHRVRVLHRNSTSALMEFVPRRKRQEHDHRGHFIDVRTLAKALTGEGHSLASLADLLATEHRKADAGEHGAALTPEYVRYAELDVQVTWEAFEILAGRYASYGLTQTPPTRIMSEATIGKASLREMGVQPWRDVQPAFPPEKIGQIVSAYYGGRSEVRVRREIAEVIHCDFRSMYPTVCTLMGLWQYVTAQGIRSEDATDEIRRMLATVEPDALQRTTTWQGLAVLVRVRARGDRFPVRANYAGLDDDPDRPDGQYGIAQSYLTTEGDETLWFTLADCIASTLITGRPPEVVEAIRFHKLEAQPDLDPLDIAGNPDYRIDPYTDDFYKRLVDLRADTKTRGEQADRAGNDELARRLDAEQQALKLTANATSYGCFIELNPTDLDTHQTVTAYGLDGEGFASRVIRHETPGRYFHPLIATLITGAARLMLTLAEHLADQQGLDWVFMDTDSIALRRPEAMSRDEFVHAVEHVRGWFAELNPYETKGSLLQLEKVNYGLHDGRTTDQHEPLYCYAISPKRYALFNLETRTGRPVLRKASAHGLGHLLDPYSEDEAPADIPPPAQPLGKIGVSRWQYDLWYRAVQAALDDTDVDLATLLALERPAMTSYTLSTRQIADWFTTGNAGKPYQQQTRAFGFFISPVVRAFSKPLGRASQPFHLVAPYDKTQGAWATTTFNDIYSGQNYGISIDHFDRQTARVSSYAEVIERYLAHPDPRRLDQHGRRCTRSTRGTLAPRHILVVHVEQIGKEANRLEELEAGVLDNVADTHTRYADSRRDPWKQLVLPVLRDLGVAELSRNTHLSTSALSDILRGHVRPHERNRRRLLRAANEHARSELTRTGQSAPSNQLAALHAYLSRRPSFNRRTCTVCRSPLPGPRATYCGAACKQRAFRTRHHKSG